MTRVADFAKTVGLPAGIVLAQAKTLGLEITTTLSALDEEELGTLRGWAGGLSDADKAALVDKAETDRRARRAKAATARSEEARKNREAVEEHRRLALAAEAGKPLPKPTPEAAEPPKPATPKPDQEQKPAPAAEPEKPAEPKPAPATEPKPVEPPKPAEPKPVAEPPKPAPVAAPERKKPTLTPTPAPTPAPSKPAAPAPSRPTLVGLAPTKPAQKDGGRGRAAKNERGPHGDRRGEHDRRGAERAPTQPPRLGAAAPAAVKTGKTLNIQGPMPVKELAELLEMRPNVLIMELMGLNILASINQTLEPGIIGKIAEKHGYAVAVETHTAKTRSAERKPQLKSVDADDEIPEDKPEDMKLRPPVVTFLGHVDHGKTTLMDYIRHTHVAAGEAGGITQHIAAYTIEVDQRDEQGNKRLITFVDTPGHAAFESMRARGANITDIAVIIVAADDGVMPQTREAIKHARNAGVQMLVAITKCDKPEANTMRVYQMLQAEGLTPSAWGGDIECCEVSGVTGQGVDELLEVILLQADVMELQANPNRRANGAVIESQLEQGLGPTATLLVKGGTLHVGDVVLCGEHYGKVRTLIDERGKQVKAAGPSIAVKCTGLSGVPEAGSEFRVMLNEKRARELAEATAEANKVEALSAAQSSAMADWTKVLAGGETAQLDVIVKGDAQGTAEAVVECLKAIESKKVSLKVLYSGVGSVTAADVQRAKGAIVVGFGVNCEPGVQAMARQNGVRINTFRIIYELIEHVKRCMLDLIPPEYKEVVRGHAEVRQVFDISKLGKIAGCQMLDGTLKFKGKFRIFRGKHQIFDGAVATMKHFKDDVKEIAPAQECGLGFGSFEEFQEGDIVECYEMEELPKTL